MTITGCLEMSVDETEFRLTDTEGVEAPKSRSWRTGFLKKHSSSIALVEMADAHALQAQVGKRVAATGVLNERLAEAQRAARRLAITATNRLNAASSAPRWWNSLDRDRCPARGP